MGNKAGEFIRGGETQEILVGTKSGNTGFVTQRSEYRAGYSGLRDYMLRETLALRKHPDAATTVTPDSCVEVKSDSHRYAE